jgi:hypothetical protein
MTTSSETGVEPDLYLQISKDINVSFPEKGEKYSQDEEFCTIHLDGIEKRVRFHDYNEVYSIPGLYEKIFYEYLRCCSHKTVCDHFFQELKKHRYSANQLRVLEIGAGNGMVGEQLRQSFVSKIIGIDILIEAKLAAYRDRPKVYDDYYAIDLTEIPKQIEEEILQKKLNSMVSVAALGFDDLPPLAYAKAFNLISENGWIALNIKDEFLSEKDESGFSKLIKRMIKDGILTINTREKYQHRLATDNTPLYYYAIIGQKQADIPLELLSQLT